MQQAQQQLQQQQHQQEQEQEREQVSLWGGAGVKCRLPFSSRILTAFARRLVNPGESDDHIII